MFRGLARKVESDVHLRAGMKLTLESAVDGGHRVYREWVDLTGELVDQGIKAAVIVGGACARRLAWNLVLGSSAPSTPSRSCAKTSTSLRASTTLSPHISIACNPHRDTRPCRSKRADRQRVSALVLGSAL